MTLKIPYCRQLKEYYCGPAALKMVLGYHRIKVSQSHLAKLIKTSKKHGTRRRVLVDVLSRFGLRPHHQINANFKEIQHWLKKSLPVIVNYHLKSDGHYAVVKGLTKEAIILADPFYGQHHRLDKKEFLKSWFCYHKKAKRRWLLAAIGRRHI